MSLADRIEGQLPYLRRYARASMGDTESGDSCVEAALARIIHATQGPVGDLAHLDRLHVFKWVEDEIRQARPADSARAHRAMLLVAMEAFSDVDAAEILGVDQDVISQMLETAEADFSTALAARMLIIEDEPLIAAQLKRIAESAGHAVVGHAVDADAAVAKYAEQKPDIILADIQLADGSLGTDAIKEMDLPVNVPVIFITAYPERFLAEQNIGPTYLITKPFLAHNVRTVIGQALLQAVSAKPG